MAYGLYQNNIIPAYLNSTNIGNTLIEQTPETSAQKEKNPFILKLPTYSPAITPADQQGTFILKQLVLIGTTIPIPAQVKAVYEAALNHPINLNGLQKLAAQIQNSYRELGYILVRVIIPPQQVSSELGIFKLQVIEGQINRVIFTGDDPQAAKAQLLRYAAAIENENPITYRSLEHFLILANNLPGINVSTTLVPAQGVVGGADLLVNVQEQKQSAFINFNNRGTAYIGPGQALAGVSIYDILGADSLNVSGALATSKASELNYLNLSYNLVVGAYGTQINPSVASTVTRPGGALAPFELLGNSLLYTLAIDQPLIASLTQNLTLNTAISHLNNTNTAFGNFNLYDDSISTVTGGLSYQGLFWQSYNNISFSTSLGLPILGAPSTLSNPSRVNGTNQFIVFNLNTSSTHYISQAVSFVLSTAFQVTPDPLLSSEQIGYGGAQFGQAFIPYIFSGDNGALGSLALRYNFPSYKWINLIQPEIFYDAGIVSDNRSIAGSPNSASGSSAGIGLNIQIANTWQIGTTLAKAIRLNNSGNSYSSSWQAFINVTGIF